jgi:hypothetical protein
MRKRNFLFALILIELTTSFTLAQNVAKTSARNVKGQILSSDNLLPLRVKFKKPHKFVGSQSFVLYEKAQVEQFFFVEADDREQIKRLLSRNGRPSTIGWKSGNSNALVEE